MAQQFVLRAISALAVREQMTAEGSDLFYRDGKACLISRPVESNGK